MHSLLHADGAAFLSASAHGPQQVPDSRQSFAPPAAANQHCHHQGLVFAAAYLVLTRKVMREDLQRIKWITYGGVLFHKGGTLKHAIQAACSKACKALSPFVIVTKIL